MRALLFPLALAAVASLAGCATSMAKVAPGPLTIRNELTVNLTQDWNQLVPGGGAASGVTGASEIWTAEGMPIDVLAFYVGLAEGERLSRASGVGGKHVPHFRSSMSPHEIVELYEAHATQGGSEFAVTRLAPAAFGGREGFRFEFSLVRRGDSLPMSGVGYAAVAGGKLYLMAYVAPRSYFFARHLPAVEAVAASALINAKPKEQPAPAPGSQASGNASRIRQPGFIERGREQSRNFQFRSEGVEEAHIPQRGTGDARRQ